MKFRITYFYFVLCLLVISCDDSDNEDPNIIEAIAKISGVTIADINFDEATASAFISGVTNTSSIEEHGFIYDNATITKSDQGNRLSLGQPGSVGEFKTALKNLDPSKNYFVRAYIVMKGVVTLGEEKSFDTKSYNTWYAEPVTGSASLESQEFLGMQLEVNGKGYIGFGLKTVAGNPVIPFYEFNPTTRTVTALAVCPVPHNYYTRRFAQGNNIYVISGNAIWRYSITSNSWTQLNNFPAGISPRYAFNYDGNGWVLAENGAALELYIYNATGDSWTKESTVDLGSALIHIPYGVTVINTKVYIISALAGGAAKLTEYTPETDNYKQLSAPAFSLPVGSVTDTYALTAAGTGYFVNMDSREIWEYSTSQDSWTKISTPATTAARNVLAIDNKLYIVTNGVFKYVAE
jgi:hypothetical protein